MPESKNQLLSTQESHFETALRITKELKENEDWIIDKLRNGDSYLNSIDVLNIVYEALTERFEDVVKTHNDVVLDQLKQRSNSDILFREW